MKQQPPKWATKFLHWFCREDYLEEVEGDLVELFEVQFEQSPNKARRQFIWRVLLCLQPIFLKSIFQVKHSNRITMLKHNIKISWRSLKRQPFFTLLNTAGLAIGISGALLIALFINDELTFDRMFDNSERIYRVNIDNKTAGEVNKYAAVSAPLADVMRRDFPHLEMVARFRHTESKLIRQKDATQNVKEDNVVGADSFVFEMFGLNLLMGDEATALKEKYAMVMTRTAAEKHFGLTDALGQEVLVDNDQVYIVTGIIEDFPKNSFLRDYGILLSISSFDDFDSPAWNLWNFPTFVKLKPEADPEQLQTYLGTVLERYLIPWASQFIPGLTVESAREQNRETGNYMRFEAIAFNDIHLKSPNISGEFNLNSDMRDVYILGIIGTFLLILASVNFMNLSTAQSLQRSKEVGIRKTLGSVRSSLINQFLTEAIILSFLSLILAVCITLLVLPYFNLLSGKFIQFPLAQPLFWLLVLVLTLFLGLISGSYPAFMMSRFSPLKSLRGGGEKTGKGAKTRSALVVFQFAISVFLIASTLIVFQQLRFIQTKDLGYAKDQVLVLNDVRAAGNQVQALKQEVLGLGSVKRVSLSSYLPTPSDRGGTTYFPEGKVFDGSSAIITNQWLVDFDYLDLLDLEIISGRGFDKSYLTDSSAVILNESTVKLLGKNNENVIGIRITDDFRKEAESDMHFYTVIGVVKNFHYETLRNDIDGLTLVIGGDSDRMMVKLQAADFSNTISQIEDIWKTIAPGEPFDFYFMDDSFADVYEAEQRLSKIFIVFTMLSLVVACLGLFGLATFNAERRSKEIGIRKVLGASIGQISVKLSVDFLKLVLVSIILATPFAWWAMGRWLEDFSFRINIPVWVFGLAAALAVIISVLTIGYQSIRAASRNPVKALRSE